MNVQGHEVQASRFLFCILLMSCSFNGRPGNYTKTVCKFSDFPGIRRCLSLLLAIWLTAFVVLSELIHCNVYLPLEQSVLRQNCYKGFKIQVAYVSLLAATPDPLINCA